MIPTPQNSRPRLPRKLAVIDRDKCTGCESCVEVCPADCINTISRSPGVKGRDCWCEVDWARCIGCELCIHLPQWPSHAYRVPICPWEAIEMVETPDHAPRPAETADLTR